MNVEINFCPTCGMKLPKESRFCSHCGLNITALLEKINAVDPTPTAIEKPSESIERLESIEKDDYLDNHRQGPIVLSEDIDNTLPVVSDETSMIIGNNAEYILKLLHEASISRTYFKGNIPDKKLLNAVQFIAGDIKFDDVLAIIDDTIFGSAKDGAVFTNNSIYLKNTDIDQMEIKIDGVKNVSLVKNIVNKLDNKTKKVMILEFDGVNGAVKLQTDVGSTMDILTVIAKLLSGGEVTGPEVNQIEQTISQQEAEDDEGLTGLIRTASKIVGGYKEFMGDEEHDKSNEFMDRQMHNNATYEELNYYINHPIVYPGYMQISTGRERKARLNDLEHLEESPYYADLCQLSDDEIVNFIGDGETYKQWAADLQNDEVSDDDLEKTRMILLEAQRRHMKINRLIINSARDVANEVFGKEKINRMFGK